MFVILSFLVGFFVGALIWSLVVERSSSVPSVPSVTHTGVKSVPAVTTPVLKCRKCGETEGRRGPFKTPVALRAHMGRCQGWP